jgi:hypothetical protein
MYNQMIDFQKATFDNSFTAMTKMQEQGDAMLNVFLNQASWLPEEGKTAITNWTKGCRTARDNFQKMVNENFKSIETATQSFAEPAKTASKAK